MSEMQTDAHKALALQTWSLFGAGCPPYHKIAVQDTALSYLSQVTGANWGKAFDRITLKGLLPAENF